MSGYSTGRTRPFTGQEYLESLQDGREIWIYGERVKDVTTHPAFRNTVRMIARLYDALHDPARRDVLTTPTDTGSGGYTHKFLRRLRHLPAMTGTSLPDRRSSASGVSRSRSSQMRLNTLRHHALLTRERRGPAPSWKRRFGLTGISILSTALMPARTTSYFRV